MPPCGEHRATIEDANVVQPKKATLKDILAFDVLSIDPPGEVEHEFVEYALQKIAVASTAISLLLNLIHLQCRPGMYRWINVTKSPLICRYLAVGMHIPLAEHEKKLVFSKSRVEVGKGYAMKREVPCGIP